MYSIKYAPLFSKGIKVISSLDGIEDDVIILADDWKTFVEPRNIPFWMCLVWDNDRQYIRNAWQGIKC